MITTATINIDDRVKKAGQQIAREMGLRGKFSEYIELLIKADLKSKKIQLAANSNPSQVK